MEARENKVEDGRVELFDWPVRDLGESLELKCSLGQFRIPQTKVKGVTFSDSVVGVDTREPEDDFVVESIRGEVKISSITGDPEARVGSVNYRGAERGQTLMAWIPLETLKEGEWKTPKERRLAAAESKVQSHLSALDPKDRAQTGWGIWEIPETDGFEWVDYWRATATWRGQPVAFWRSGCGDCLYEGPRAFVEIAWANRAKSVSPEVSRNWLERFEGCRGQAFHEWNAGESARFLGEEP